MYYSGNLLHDAQEYQGWPVGSHVDKSHSLRRNGYLEIGVFELEPGHFKDYHGQRTALKIIVVLSGRMIQGVKVAGEESRVEMGPLDYLIIAAGELTADLEVLEPTVVQTIKTPSIPGDKFEPPH